MVKMSGIIDSCNELWFEIEIIGFCIFFKLKQGESQFIMLTKNRIRCKKDKQKKEIFHIRRFKFDVR